MKNYKVPSTIDGVKFTEPPLIQLQRISPVSASKAYIRPSGSMAPHTQPRLLRKVGLSGDFLVDPQSARGFHQ